MPSVGFGYVPSLQEIYAELVFRVPAVSRAIIETRVIVYETGSNGAHPRDAGNRAVKPGEYFPAEATERGFQQRIYWIRDRLLAIETLNTAGDPIHFYMDEGLGEVAGDLTGTRHFEPVDVRHPYIPFMAGSLNGWLKGMEQWGVYPTSVRLRRAYKSKFLYTLTDGEGSYAAFDPKRLQLKRIECLIEQSGQPARLSIVFGGSHIYGGKIAREKLLYFPRTVDFFIDGKLVKQITLLRLRHNPSLREFPLIRLRKSARDLIKVMPPSLAEHDIR